MSVHNRSLIKRSKNAFSKITQGLSVKQRLDTSWVLGLLIIFVALLIAWWAYVGIGLITDWFDQPPIQPLADERILENVRDNLKKDALLDAVFHPADNHLYISQEGGVIHRYDPITHLWDTEHPFSANDPIETDFVQLRAGCGYTLDSAKLNECLDKQALWALSKSGNLARYDGANWQIVVNNTQFIDARGNPVESSSLVAAAVSEDQRWVLLGTRNNSIGIYDTRQQRWLPADTFTDKYPQGEIIRIVWWRDFFWIGASQGLFQVEVEADGSQIQIRQQTKGQIVDLDADPNGSLWLIERRNCLETKSGNGCLWLGQFTQPNQPPKPVIDEQHRYPELDLNNLTFAQQTDNLLTLAGPAGIYTYDTVLHSWKRLSGSEVITVLPLRNGQGFYYAQASSIGLVSQGEITTTRNISLSDDLIRKLLYGQTDDEILALTKTGNLYSLSAQLEEFQAVYQQDDTAFNPNQFSSAATISDTVLFKGPEGVLLHDTRRRLYNDITGDDIPLWLLDPATELIGNDGDIYALTPGLSENTDIYALPRSQVTRPNYYRSDEIFALEPYEVPGPLQNTWKWGDEGLGVLAADNSVYRFTVEDEQRLTGPELPITSSLLLSDAAGFNNSLAVIRENKFETYSLESRTWNDFDIQLNNGERLEELAATDTQFVLRTNQGRLISEQDNVLIGGQQGFGITDRNLSDVTDRNQYLYLAGDGRVEQYDMDAREVAKVWEIDNSGQVSIRGIVSDEPLTLVKGQAALGETILPPLSEPVTNLSHDSNFIWTVRADGEILYLMGHDPNYPTDTENARCYFRNPTAGSDVQTIYDARELSEGLIAVLTNAGLKFYNAQGRTWHNAPIGFPKADRLYYLDFAQNKDYLLFVTNQSSNSFNLMFIKTSDIKFPGPCSTQSVEIENKQPKVVKAVAINELKARVAWLTTDDKVVEWIAGTEKEIIGSQTNAPDSSTFKRIVDRQLDGYLLFTTNSHY